MNIIEGKNISVSGERIKYQKKLKNSSNLVYKLTFKKYDELEDRYEIIDEIIFDDLDKASEYAHDKYSFYEIYNHDVEIKEFIIKKYY